MDENPVQADGDSGWVSPEMVLAQLQSCVAGLFAEHHDVRVLSIQEISAGWESDVYAFDAALDGDQERLVLRIYPGNDATRKSALEYEALRALGRVGYPVPAVHLLVARDHDVVEVDVDGHACVSHGSGRPVVQRDDAVLAVPATAVHTRDAGDYVLALEEGILRERPIRTGTEWPAAGLVEASSGLTAGDAIIGASLAGLSAGTPVVITRN